MKKRVEQVVAATALDEVVPGVTDAGVVAVTADESVSREIHGEIVIDDRDDVRNKIRGLVPGMMVYGPDAFLKPEGESHGHPLR